jgi:hypothetical protein
VGERKEDEGKKKKHSALHLARNQTSLAMTLNIGLCVFMLLEHTGGQTSIPPTAQELMHFNLYSCYTPMVEETHFAVRRLIWIRYHRPSGTGWHQNIPNTKICCGFFQTGISCSDRMQYSRSLLRDL